MFHKQFRYRTKLGSHWFSPSLTRGNLSPTLGTLAMSGDIFGCHNWGKERYWQLVGKGQDTAKILQCTGQPSKLRIMQSKMSIVLKLRNPDVIQPLRKEQSRKITWLFISAGQGWSFTFQKFSLIFLILWDLFYYYYCGKIHITLKLQS